MARKIVDLSHHNLEQGQQYNFIVVADNVDAIIYKISDLWFVTPGDIDPTFFYAYDGFKAAGLPIGGYLFDRPDATVKDNWDRFMGGIKDRPLNMVAIDLEDWGTLSQKVYSQHVIDMFKEGENRTGKKCWLYCNYDGLNNRMTTATPVLLAPHFEGIWLANPNKKPGDYTKPKYYSKEVIGIHQYDWWGSVPGIKDPTIDLSMWVWTEEKFVETFGDQMPPQPSQPENSTTITITVPVSKEKVSVVIKEE